MTARELPGTLGGSCFSAKMALSIGTGRTAFVAGLALASFSSLLLESRSASAKVFVTTSPSSTNQSSAPFTSNGVTLTISNSNSTGNNPNTVNTNPTGLCAWTAVGTSAVGRCGYGTSASAGVSAFQLSFSAPVTLSSFRIAGFESANISQGSLGFSLDNSNFTDFTFSSDGDVAVNFAAGQNQPIFLRTSATFNAGADTGIFRISQFTTQESAPAPLSILGAAAAFGWSRRIKRKLAA